MENILKMIVATFVMNHPLLIARRSRAEVLARLSENVDPGEYSQDVSPWMVSMQLRYYFSIMRDKLYKETLRGLQEILHDSAGRRRRTYAFAGVLAMAVVLEDCQYTLLLQSAGQVARKEVSENEAQIQLKAQCGEIDHEFGFLVALLHCKFQDKRQSQSASLRRWIETTNASKEKAFLQAVYQEAIDESEFTSSLDDNFVSR